MCGDRPVHRHHRRAQEDAAHVVHNHGLDKGRNENSCQFPFQNNKMGTFCYFDKELEVSPFLPFTIFRGGSVQRCRLEDTPGYARVRSGDHTCVYLYIYIYIYIEREGYIYIYIYTYIYIYVYIHTHHMTCMYRERER